MGVKPLPPLKLLLAASQNAAGARMNMAVPTMINWNARAPSVSLPVEPPEANETSTVSALPASVPDAVYRKLSFTS